jgi:RNase P subunit RPR2
MADDGPPPGSDGDLEAVFELVANETRLDILRALWETRAPGDRSLSFSALRERTDVRDSGRFNYHLGKLVPEFVRKRDGEYALSHAGAQLIGDAVSGTYTAADGAEFAPTAVGDCHEPGCDGRIEARYRDGRAEFGCDSCDRRPDSVPAPPILVHPDREHVEDAPEAASRFSLLTAERINRGFCHLCDGPVEPTIARLHPDHEPVLDGAVDVIHDCRACGAWRRSGARTTLIGHPAVVSLLYDAGVDYRSRPHWEQTWLTEATERLVGEQPVRVAVRTPIGGREHLFTLDESLEVVDRG